MKKSLILMMILGVCCTGILLGSDLNTTGATSVPHLINYQARLTTPSGNPVRDGIYDILFSIYNAPTGGTPKWDHTYSVKVTNGLFNVILGESEPLDLPFDEDYWLEIKVGNDQPLLPRTRITSVGYAYRAEVANSALSAGSGGGWVDDGSVVRLENSADRVGIGTTNPMERFQVGDRIVIHDGGCKGLAFNSYWDGSVDRRIVDGKAGRFFFFSPGGDFLLDVADSDMTNTSISWTRAITVRNDGMVIVGGLGFPNNFGPDNNYVGKQGNYIAFGHPGVSEDFIGYKNNTFYFKDSPGGGDVSDPDVFIGGTTTTKILTITGGADLAEPFPVSYSEDLTPGAVVIIDDKNPGHLTLSTRSYDRRVAGIVSGAGGINSGLTLSQQGFMEGDQNIALNGRVYALATTSNGAIIPGDLLTTSDVPGHLMRATDKEQSHGAIVGKAMTPLSQGQGLILVLVNLQ
jgi:hypothetical protein